MLIVLFLQCSDFWSDTSLLLEDFSVMGNQSPNQLFKTFLSKVCFIGTANSIHEDQSQGICLLVLVLHCLLLVNNFSVQSLLSIFFLRH